LIIHANRSVDIRNALRLAEEFQLQIMLDSVAEGYLLTDALVAAEVPVLVHPTMSRATGDQENLTFRNAALLADAGVPVALQSGYEAYVPKVRVVLFEAGVAASHGFGFERALASITIDAAKMLGIDDRVGSLAVGKDADLALYDGDPFEYTTHCVGVVIDGVVVSQQNR
jgi:imidazolonepropionase-like amidohydrolase